MQHLKGCVIKLRGDFLGGKLMHLSMAGRVTLAKSVVTAIPTYAMQTLKIPCGESYFIEAKCRRFIWGNTESSRGMHHIGWNTLCKPIDQGGLAFRKLRHVNEAFTIKLG